MKITSFVKRVVWLSRYTRLMPALAFWRAALRDPYHVGSMKYQGTSVAFRGVDVMAIKEVLVNGEYDSVLSRLSDTPAPVVLDVGAHIGLFGLRVLKQYPRARVQSVEADPNTYQMLSRNVTAARDDGAAWDMLNAAAWSEDEVELRLSGAGSSMGHRINGDGDITVRGITLKTLVNRFVGAHGMIDLLKIDIEGSEEAFLCANPAVLSRVRSIVIEVHPKLCNAERVLDVLRDAYKAVTKIEHRDPSKPLLLCY